MRHFLKTLLCAMAVASVFSGNPTLRAVEVLTHHYDQANTGVNSSETQLTPSDITTSTFQKLYSTKVDSQIFTQPLYVPGVVVTGGSYPGTHNLVIVGSEGDILYAIDAATGVIVWQTSFLLSGLPGATTITPVPSSDSQDIYNAAPGIGILGTPFIDGTTNLLYVLVKTKQLITGQAEPSFVNTLYKIDITNAATMPVTDAPLNIVGRNDYAVTISDDTTYTYRTNADPSAPQDPFTIGTGDDAITVGGQSRVYLNALRCLHRSALIMANGNIYACFASAVGIRPYHGWMLGFDKGTLAVTSVTDLTPNAFLGGIWASGAHPAVDSSGNIFLALGNGYFDGTIGPGLDPMTNLPAAGDYGDCLVKLVPDPTTSPSNQNINGWGIKVADYFTPSDNYDLYYNDWDLGCGGILLLPDSYGSTAHPHLLVTAGKEGTIYLLDRDGLGKFSTTKEGSVQELLKPALLQNWCTPALFNGTLFFAAENDYGKAFSIANGVIATTPIKTPDTFALRGATPTISANGTTDGVVWTVTAAYNAAGQLRAYSAANFANEIWTSDQAANGRDALGTGVRFSVPTVADGRVFVGTTTNLVAYGLNPAVAVITSDPPPATAIAGARYNFTFTAAGTPYPTFALTSGTFPPGLTLAPTGVLSGIPTTPGSYSATVTASGSGLTSNTQSFTITISTGVNGPVGYWECNEGAGTTTADFSGNGQTGTLVNSPTWVAGMLGDALNFNGTSSYVGLKDASLTSPLKTALPISISAWIYIKNGSGSHTIFASDNWIGVHAGSLLQITNGVLSCDYGNGHGNSSLYRQTKVGTTVMKTGQWYHVAAVMQGPASMNLYVNGVDDGGTYSGTGGSIAYTTAASKIGTDGTNYFNGTIDDVRLYNRGLTPTEVELLANGPVSNWRFDDGSGTSALDSGTAGITGTLVNSPTYTAGWFNDALNFNGTSSYVGLNDASLTSPLKAPLPITISAWIYIKNGSGFHTIFASDNWSAVHAGSSLLITNGVLSCNYGNAHGSGSADRQSKVGTTVMKTGQWYHVAAVMQGPTSMNLYINGADDGGTYNGTGGSLEYTTAPSKIGTDGAYYFNGVIDDMRVYNRALSAAEIQTLDNASSGTIPPE
jgi:hypothetical protein